MDLWIHINEYFTFSSSEVLLVTYDTVINTSKSSKEPKRFLWIVPAYLPAPEGLKTNRYCLGLSEIKACHSTVLITDNLLIVGKFGQGMRSYKCTSNDQYVGVRHWHNVKCASDTMLSVCMSRCVCVCWLFMHVLMNGRTRLLVTYLSPSACFTTVEQLRLLLMKLYPVQYYPLCHRVRWTLFVKFQILSTMNYRPYTINNWLIRGLAYQ